MRPLEDIPAAVTIALSEPIFCLARLNLSKATGQLAAVVPETLQFLDAAHYQMQEHSELLDHELAAPCRGSNLGKDELHC